MSKHEAILSFWKEFFVSLGLQSSGEVLNYVNSNPGLGRRIVDDFDLAIRTDKGAI